MQTNRIPIATPKMNSEGRVSRSTRCRSVPTSAQTVSAVFPRRARTRRVHHVIIHRVGFLIQLRIKFRASGEGFPRLAVFRRGGFQLRREMPATRWTVAEISRSAPIVARDTAHAGPNDQAGGEQQRLLDLARTDFPTGDVDGVSTVPVR